MSVVIVGGNECMNRKYQEICKEYSCSSKVYTKMSNGLKSGGIGCPDLLVLFTDTISHKMVRFALSDAKGKQIKIARSHTSSASALKNILNEHIK